MLAGLDSGLIVWCCGLEVRHISIIPYFWIRSNILYHGVGGNTMNSEIETLLTEQQVASILQRSLPSLRNDRYANRGVPFVRVCGGRMIRYFPQDVVAYLDSLPRGGEQPQGAVKMFA